MGGPERPAQPDGSPPFGKEDDSVLDALIQRELANTRKTLRAVQAKLTQMRYKPGPDQQVPAIREITRADGQWPFLLIRTYPGDVGKRPVQLEDPPPGYAFGALTVFSPDIIVAEPGPQGEPRIIDRDEIAALKERERPLYKGWTYDVWVHVWNLGQSQVSGVRVRLRISVGTFLPDPEAPMFFIGGTTLDLGDRLSERAHRAVKVASITTKSNLFGYSALLSATADTLSDPSSGDMSIGADRHTAYRAVFASQEGPPQFG